MEDLFSTNISVDNENLNYRVIFEGDKYTFITDANTNKYPAFSFRRENDEWHDQELLPPEVKKQAVDALEKYLMRQH